MLRDLITPDTIQIVKQVANWEHAIDLAAAPLVFSNRITKDYVNAVKQNIHRNGSYLVLRDHFALPHARPQQGVRQLCMSLLVLGKPVAFATENTPVSVLLLLAAVDTDTHLKALSDLITLMSDDALFEQIRHATTVDSIMRLIYR